MFEGFKWPTFEWTGKSSPINFAGLQLPKISLSGGGGGSSAAPKPVLGGTSSVNAFASTHPKIQDALPWDKIAAAVSAKTKSSIPSPADYGGDYTDPYAKFDPEKMAAREFDPQFALISQMEAQAKQNYGQGAKDIGHGWDLIAQAVAGREKGLRADYSKMGSDISSGWGGVGKAADTSFDQARAEIIENAKRSGSSMESIAPLLAQLATSKAEQAGTTGARGQTAGQFNARQGQNAVEANQLAVDEAKWGGINARQDFALRLQGALQDLGNKRLETQGARGAAVNKYGLDITDKSVSAKNAWEQIQTQRAGQAIDMEAMRAKAEADAAEAKAPKEIDPNKLTPTEYLSYIAGGLYNRPGEGTGPGSRAENAVKAIQDTIINNKGGFKDVKAFVDAVLKRNPNASRPGGDAQQLAQLAEDYYYKLAGGANKGLGNAQLGLLG